MFCFFFFNDTATTEIYTLSLHDALPIFLARADAVRQRHALGGGGRLIEQGRVRDVHAGEVLHHRLEIQQRLEADRKSTRLNSSHANISYAVFCLKKKQKRHLTFLSTRRF